MNPIILIGKNEISTVAPRDLTAEIVGSKALGLACLPLQWVPDFVVIPGSLVRPDRSTSSLQYSVGSQLKKLGFIADDLVIVRSSGVYETLEHAGRFESEMCPAGTVVQTIASLSAKLPEKTGEGIHWIVQRMANTKQKGHLSNERHLKREHRDWLLEFDLILGGQRTMESIAVRPWRDGSTLDLDLACSSIYNIPRCLKRVALWATRATIRVHFEWVWDGDRVFIVQLQPEMTDRGIAPRSLIPKRLPPVRPTGALKIFRTAEQHDFNRYKKLANAKLYSQLGYAMPEFYVLDHPQVVKKIVTGKIPSSVSSDLDRLTFRPLVIRTDGVDIPEEKREMLPRSEGLYDAASAIHWMKNDFREQLKENDLLSCSLTLIAHSFIPSVSSAWARAEPNNRFVRIESIWGIPEGLYWYAHDTFIVDLLESSVKQNGNAGSGRLKVFEHTRYKDNFIAPDIEGKWISFHPSPRHQWGRSIQKDSWLLEIATTTSRIAEHRSQPTALMWFVDTHAEAVPNKVLPWFHCRSEIGEVSAAPRNKFRGSEDVVIERPKDWDSLKNDVGKRRIERVIVSPRDPQLVRNPKFARDLGKLAVQYDFVVELSGGVLSHAYYVLKRSGARVECADLFEEGIETIEYHKVVRDLIPEVILRQGEDVVIRRLAGDALVTALRHKLVEEAFEVLDMPLGSDLISELVDVEEVVDAIYSVLGISRKEVSEARAAKSKRRGAFVQGFLLEKTLSVAQRDRPSGLGLGEVSEDPLTTGPIISEVAELPSNRVYRRPDLRIIGANVEKLVTVELDLNTDLDHTEELGFSIPASGGTQELTLNAHFKRSREKLRVIVRVRSEPVQLALDFDN